MAYATSDDVIRRYKPILTMLGTGTLDITTVDIASVYVQDGESIINAFLSRRYVIPLTTEPLLTDLASDIAIYRILSDKAPRIPDFMEKRYTNAMSLLTMIRDGQMDLNLSSQSVNSGGGDQYAWSNVLDGNGPVFAPAEAMSLDIRVTTGDKFSQY